MHPLNETDKHFWHRYTDEYEKAILSIAEVKNVMEFGVFQGQSIRWLRTRFPKANIVGLDIVAQKSNWPVDDSIKYLTIDQENRADISALLSQVGNFYDFVIEDGSHRPTHQLNSLLATLPWMNIGSVYIVEDIHTCLTDFRNHKIIHPAIYRNYFEKYSIFSQLMNVCLLPFRRISKILNPPRPVVNILTLLLFVEKSLSTGRKIDSREIETIEEELKLPVNDIDSLLSRIKKITFVKRAGLPLSCYSCGSRIFRPELLQCMCGRPIYPDDESMSAILFF